MLLSYIALYMRCNMYCIYVQFCRQLSMCECDVYIPITNSVYNNIDIYIFCNND